MTPKTIREPSILPNKRVSAILVSIMHYIFQYLHDHLTAAMGFGSFRLPSWNGGCVHACDIVSRFCSLLVVRGGMVSVVGGPCSIFDKSEQTW